LRKNEKRVKMEFSLYIFGVHFLITKGKKDEREKGAQSDSGKINASRGKRETLVGTHTVRIHADVGVALHRKD